MEIIPGIFEIDFEEIKRKISLVQDSVSWVQVDFSDGTLVPAQTFFDILKFAALIKQYDKHDNGLPAARLPAGQGRQGHPLHFEAHLMVTNPEKYVRQLAEAGFERIIAQVEAADPRLFLEEAKLESVEAGLAMDSTTEIEQIEPLLEEVDCVLVMMAEAGSKAAFQPENVEKVRLLRQHFPDLPLEAENGITRETAKLLTVAGATRLVPSAGSLAKI